MTEMDPASMLLSAGLSLASKLIFSWVREGRSRVKISEVDRVVNDQARAEADRLRVRVDDLESSIQRMLAETVAATPQLGYVKPRVGAAVLALDYNPRDPRSSGELLQELRNRVAAIALNEGLSETQEQFEASDNPDHAAKLSNEESQGARAGFKVVSAASSRSEQPSVIGETSTSAAMLEKLKRTVEQADEERR